jgi:adenylate cyclase
VLILSLLNSFDRLELKIFDTKMTSCAETLNPDSSIVMVAIDQKSLDFFEDNAVSWPWPREFYGYVLKFLKKAGAKAVFFDIDFSSSEIERIEVDASDSENSFANAIDISGNVVLSLSLNNTQDGKNNILPKFLIVDSTIYPRFNNSIAPLSSFQKSAKEVGVVNVNPDFDGIIRRAPLLFGLNNMSVKSAALALFSVAKNEEIVNLDLFKQNIPKELFINWYGKGGVGQTFPYYSIHSLIVSAAKIEENLSPDLSLNIFKDKVVIIGGTAFGLLDYRPVPVSSVDSYPGMEIHATILSNLLKKHFITESSSLVKWLFILFLSFLSPIFLLKYPKIISSIFILLFVAIILFLLNYYSFYFYRYNLELISPGLALLLSFVLTGYVNYLREGKQKKEIKKIFSRYISPQVVNELLENYEDVELGGKEVEATVFFSDIKNFTSISESLSPKELVFHLNNYLTLTSEVILEQKAMLDKYIGDAIMAIFGTPIKVENHALSACKAALKIQKLLEIEHQKSVKSSLPQFVTRIGLNTGKMIVGNIGSTARTDYTVIGDSVNTASRLEGINKIYGTNIIISESTYEMVKEQMLVRELDKLRVKGKENPVKIFELISENREVDNTILEKIKYFGIGLENYRNRKWNDAIEMFKNVLLIDKYDSPSKLFIDRCEKLSKMDLDSNWDGIFNAKTK